MENKKLQHGLVVIVYFARAIHKKILIRRSRIVFLPNAFWCSAPQFPPQKNGWDSRGARNYSSVPAIPSRSATLITPGFNLDPCWVTGFVDGEGCFYVAVIKNKNSQHGGWKVQPRFQLTLHYRDKALMVKIQKFFNVGKISKEGRESICLQVQSIKELETVINHFAKFELKTKKHADFKLFLRIHEMKKRKEHLTKEGLMEIVAIKASMNRGLSEKMKSAFPDVVPVVRPLVINQKIKDPNWLVGFSSAEGCFFIHVYPDSRYVTGFQVKLVFEISQHIWDEIIMRSLVEFLKCGVIFKNREAISPLF